MVLPVPEDQAPVPIGVAELMAVPDGCFRAGDELLTGENWNGCVACRTLYPAGASTCFNCGAELE